MSDKPLAEQMRENEKYIGGACADMVEQFVREHLTEQTEPSTEDWKIAKASHAGIGGPCEDENCYQCYSRAYIALSVRNAQRRRVRELLVGKETK